MPAAELQLLRDTLLAPPRLLPYQLFHRRAQALAADLRQHLIGQPPQMIAQGTVGLDLRQIQLVDAEAEAVTRSTKMHRATNQLSISRRIRQRRMRKPKS